jgi:hypothetical protein
MGSDLRSTDIPSTMGCILGLVVDTIITSALERPEQPRPEGLSSTHSSPPRRSIGRIF